MTPPRPNPRVLVLVLGVAECLASVAFVVAKGHPENRVSFDAVAEIGEGLLSTVGKTKNLLLPVDDEEETTLGDRIHEKAVAARRFASKSDPILERYVSDVGGKVAGNVKRKGIRYRFHLVESAYPDAFSSAGGHVYVTTGLLKTLRSEAELAGVLAHEITHVDAKHCIAAIQRSVGGTDEPGPDTLVAAGLDLFLRPGYSEAQESEADAGAAYLTSTAGYHPEGLVRALERIDRPSDERDRSITPIGDTLDAVGGLMARYFRSHPPTRERVEKIRRVVAENGLAGPGRKFYAGTRNFVEKTSVLKARYKEEVVENYPAA